MKKNILLSFFLFLLSGLSSATLISFENSTTDGLDNNFNLVHPVGSPRYSQSATGGVDNSGSVVVSDSGTEDTTAVYNGQSFNFSTAGSEFSTSMFVRRSGGSSGPFNNLLTLGFVPGDNQALGGSLQAADFMSVRIVRPTNDGTPFRLELQNRVSESTTSTHLGSAFNISDNSWVKLNLTFINQSDIEVGQVGVSGFVETWGGSGTTNGGTISGASFSTTFINTAMTSDSSTYASFRSLGASGATNLDDFVVIPEPGSLWLVSMAGLTMLCIHCRKRKD